MRRLNKNKRGVSGYISWVLIVAFSISLGAFIYGWMGQQTTKATKQIEEQSETTICENVGINIDGLCQNTQVLYMNISNVNLVGVDSLIIRLFDIYDNGQITENNISMLPQDKKSLTLLKPGTLRQVEIIPVIKVSNRRLICQNGLITIKRVEQC